MNKSCLHWLTEALLAGRRAVYDAFNDEDRPLDVKVKCTNREMGGRHQAFKEMLAQMERSIFCLALPGDSPSTRRLSEIFLAGVSICCTLCCLHCSGARLLRAKLTASPAGCADSSFQKRLLYAGLADLGAPAVPPATKPLWSCAGCIPVFIGPPWNALPLSHMVDYGSVALFFNFSGPQDWWLKDRTNERWKLELPEQPPDWQHQTPYPFIQVRCLPRSLSVPVQWLLDAEA